MVSGRRKTFDENVALETAMKIFWNKGYAGTSISDLTQSMGINKPSMYNAFGNKESLFIKALDNYLQNQVRSHMGILNEEGAPLRTRLKNYMMSIVTKQCGGNNPRGCFIVMCQGEVLGKNIPEEASIKLNEAGEKVQNNLQRFFETDPEAIELGLNHHARENALSIATVLRGTASMARSKRSPDELEFVVESTIKGIGLH